MKTGDRLAHYEILARLGQGGMGEVLRARDTKLGREVALKILPAAFTDDPDRHARFHREAHVLASLSHPNVAVIHSLEEAAGRHFLVMELVPGEELAERLTPGPLPTAAALDIARRIAAALEAAHAHGIVHRDLKPQNVKLTPDGAVKVLDFGLAKLHSGDGEAPPDADTMVSPTLTPDTTRAGTILGTAAYMSPEQARSRPVDRRADIWAFGCVLYEMLTGRRAFPGDSVSDTLAQVLRSEPDWSALPADLPPAVAHVLRRCLQKDARRRLHDVADARIELEDALVEDRTGGVRLADQPVAAAGPGRPPTSRRPRTLLAVAAIGWLAAAAALLLPRLGSSPPETPARVRNLTYSGRDWAPSASPDGEMIAFASDRDGRSRIWLRQMTGGSEAPLTGGQDDLPRFSPDGSQILFVRDEADGRNLYRTTVVGSQVRKLIDDVIEADWSPDGERVAFLRMRPGEGNNQVLVGVADARTGVETILAEVTNRACYGIRWSPDGRWLTMNESSLVGNVAEASTVDLIDTHSGELQRLTLTAWRGPYTAVAWLPSSRGFVVGQAVDVLTHVLDTPAQIMRYDLDSGRAEPLFWASVRVPRGGWGFSALTLLDGDRMVLDTDAMHAGLVEVTWPQDGQPQRTRTLTSSLGIDRQPAFSPDGRRVIFSSNRSGNVDLWVLDRETGDLRQLTDDPADDWDPDFSPDGEHVLWSSDRGGNMEIWMAQADGSRARQVSRDGVDAENPTMTPDGQWIVYASSNDEKLGVWKVRPDGSDGMRLHAGSLLLPEVSPDGRHALFVQYRNLDYVIHVVDIETGELVDFAIETGARERHLNVVFGRARWTPDGSGIVYVGQDEQGRIGVFVQDFAPGADTSATRRPVTGFARDAAIESLGISPDGAHLVVSEMVERRTVELAEHVGLDLER